MSDPFLDALNAQAGVGARLTTDQLAQMVQTIPGARITSGVRDPQHNAAVGGVPNSQHIAGTALDFVAPGMTLAEVQAKFPGEQIIQHDAGSGMHFHVQGGPGTTAPPPEQPQAAAPPPQAANDPFLAALDHATQGGNGSPQSPAADGGNSSGGGPVAAPDGSGSQNGSGGFGSALKSPGTGLASISPLSDSIVNGRNYFSSLRDDAAGFASGALKVPETALNVGANIADHIPYGEDIAKGFRGSADGISKWGGKLANDPNSGAYHWGQLGGEVGATLPYTEFAPAAVAAPLTTLARTAKAGKVAAGLARYGDMALQGAEVSTALSGGHDMGKAALTGALIAPVAGAAGDALLPTGLKVAGAVSDKAKAIAERLKGGATDEAPAVAQTIAKASDLPIGNIEVTHTGTPFPADVAPSVPKSATPEEVQQALGSRGARSGIEATTQFPADTAAHIDQLRMQGVPLEQAIREADITAVGGSPTAADVTRNPALMTAVKEGAKSTSTEGQALSLQAAGNNAALHQTTQDMVHDYGGAPAPGDAMQGAAESLKKASDAAYKGVSDAYDAARQAEGDQSVRPDQIREVLNSKEAKALVAGGGPEGQLITTVGKLVDLYTDNGTKGLSPDEFNSITKIANQKYDPMGGGVNHWVGQINRAVDDGLDSFDKAGPAYRAARAKMRDYASQYRDPKGVSGLIRSDATGSLVGDNTWRSAENMIGSKNDKPFLEIANQLKKNGDYDALNRLKASIVQNAYEGATGRSAGTAADQGGNSVFSGSKFHARLNDIGMNKLKAVFSDQEIAKLAQIGRAGVAVNEAVPGTVNTSHTASAIVNSLKGLEGKKAGAVGKALSTALHIASPILGVAAHGGVEGAGIGTAIDGVRTGASAAINAAAKRRAASKLAEALRTSTSPAATRANEAAISAKKIADALRNRTARKASSRIAPMAAALSQGNR